MQTLQCKSFFYYNILCCLEVLNYEDNIFIHCSLMRENITFIKNQMFCLSLPSLLAFYLQLLNFLVCRIFSVCSLVQVQIPKPKLWCDLYTETCDGHVQSWICAKNIGRIVNIQKMPNLIYMQ